MGRQREDSMRCVISFRVNHEEKQTLDLMAEKAGLSISNLIREHLELIKNKSPEMRV